MYKKKIIETRERKSCFHAVEKLETMGANCDAISIGRPAFESILVKANRSPIIRYTVPSTRNLGKWYCIILSRGSETIMIIQSPLHKPSRVFTIHSFSNTYLSLSLRLSTRLSLFPFWSTISPCNSETSRYQPFLSAVLTAIPDAINPENSLREFSSDSKLHLYVYMYIYIYKYQPSFPFPLRGRGANRRQARPHEANANLSLSLGSQ